MSIAVSGMPFGANNGQAEWGQMARHWTPRSGVIPDEPTGTFAVTHDAVNGGLRVLVAPGKAHLRGFWAINSAQRTLPIDANTNANPRVDLVLIRSNEVAGTMTLEVVKGTPAAAPAPPTPTTTSTTIYEVPLAHVHVGPSAGGIVANNVLDVRVYASDSGEALNIPNGGQEISQSAAASTTGDGWTPIDLYFLAISNSAVTTDQIVSTIGVRGRSARIVYTHNTSLGGFADYKTVLDCGPGSDFVGLRGRTLTHSWVIKSTAPQTVQAWIGANGTGGGGIFGGMNVAAGVEERLTVTRAIPADATQITLALRIGRADCTVEVNDHTGRLGTTPALYAPRSRADDLRAVQRYYEVITGALLRAYNVTNASITARFSFAVRKAVTPTMTRLGTFATTNCGQPQIAATSPDGFNLEAFVTATGDAFTFMDSADDRIVADARPTPS